MVNSVRFTTLCVFPLWYFEVSRHHSRFVIAREEACVFLLLLLSFATNCWFFFQFSISYIYYTHKPELSKNFCAKCRHCHLPCSSIISMCVCGLLYLSLVVVRLYRCSHAIAVLFHHFDKQFWMVCIIESIAKSCIYTHKTRVDEPLLCSRHSLLKLWRATIEKKKITQSCKR